MLNIVCRVNTPLLMDCNMKKKNGNIVMDMTAASTQRYVMVLNLQVAPSWQIKFHQGKSQKAVMTVEMASTILTLELLWTTNLNF